MQIEMVKINLLRSAEYNPRQITEAQFAALRANIREFGVVQPAVINMQPGREYIIIGGHMRVKAAGMEGLTSFPCFKVKLDEQKEKVLNLALNKISGEWIPEKVAELITEISEDAELVQLTGFEETEVTQIVEDQEQGKVPQDDEEMAEPEKKKCEACGRPFRKKAKPATKKVIL